MGGFRAAKGGSRCAALAGSVAAVGDVDGYGSGATAAN